TPALANRNFTANIKWLERTDLKLTKVCDNNNPTNGDVINFTVTVTNDGPTAATGVEVTDLINTAFEIQSVNPSQGTYNETTGIWTVGSLSNGASATLVVTVKVNVVNVFTSQIDLGVASDFNVFVIEDINQPSSDTQGKMAAGRDIFLTNYSVGDLLPNSNGAEDILIAGRNLTFLTGAISNGNVVYGNSSNLPVSYVSVVGGEVRKDSVINFDAANSYLLNLSASLASYPTNGTDTLAWSTLTLRGSHPIINIFDVDGTDITNSSGIEINVPSGSTVIVNVRGDSVLFNGGLDLYGATTNATLYNFYESTYLTINQIDVKGSLLAPKADVNFIDGQINGQFIAKSVKGKAQFNISKFIGNIPGQTELQNIAEITKANQLDPDSEPGNGITSEDDYDFVGISVNPDLSVGSGTSNPDWELVGTFNSNEITWVITHDKNGNLLKGSSGGKISRSIDGGLTWTILNPGMFIGYVWSIQVNMVSGYIYAATEFGIFRSTNNGSTWNIFAFAGKRVPAFIFDESINLMYAAVLGETLFKSTDGGNTWYGKLTGLGCDNVSSIAINSNKDLYVGTLGGKIYKSTDFADHFTQLNIEYPYIWSIGINSSDEIFVGTYGNGMYLSSDDGATFVKQNAITDKFIYAITCEGNKVIASAWNGGVYVYQSGIESSWSQLGMVGFGVSALMLDKGVLYAVTSDGKLYKNSTVTSVNENGNNLDYSFSLEQNYPNPFNPSTIIKYSIAEASNVKLIVYDILGREIVTLINNDLLPGSYSMVWNANDKFGKKVTSGIYFYSLEAGKFTKTNKMILMK
ncbi:MAG: collagen-binding domain-containing protein, partial [bacterium]